MRMTIAGLHNAAAADAQMSEHFILEFLFLESICNDEIYLRIQFPIYCSSLQ